MDSLSHPVCAYRVKTSSYEPRSIDFAAESFIRGTFVGGIWGAMFGSYEFKQVGMRGWKLFSNSSKMAGTYGAVFGSYLAICAGTTSHLQKSRGTDDIYNAAIAGSLSAIPLAGICGIRAVPALMACSAVLNALCFIGDTEKKFEFPSVLPSFLQSQSRDRDDS
eukprot:GILJ01001105.1.p1 GENE.GILJ01001105.1~~GILJ01001105.1.p1  ORF type:complete len:164 (+),score=15.19 GILJ01001105.1:86-577(+)